MKLVQLESEVNFPHSDISDDTAATLELLLLNRELVDACHDSAEVACLLYRLGHKALNFAAKPNLADSEHLAAFSYGVSAFEAVSTLVHPLSGSHSLSKQTVALHVMTTHNALTRTFVDTLVDARDKFSEELPRTKQVIGQSAARFCRAHSDYAFSGAAIARELEIQTTTA